MVGSGGLFGYYLKPIGGAPVLGRNDGVVYDPASSFKTLLLAEAIKQVAAGADSLSSPVTVYLYPHSRNANGNPAAPTLCPDPGDETASNVVTPAPTLKDVLLGMMGQSDNRDTRAVELRYGRTAINALAQSLGMTNTVQSQILGCGDDNGVRNLWTLDDAGKLFDAIATGTIGGVSGAQTLLSLMATHPSLAPVVEPEATSLGLVRTVTPYFVGGTHVYEKGGSYDICRGSCAADDEVTRDFAGLAIFPTKTPEGSSLQPYAWGTFIANVQMSCPSFPCGAADQALNATQNSISELLRPAIRAALQTWAAKTTIVGLTARVKKLKPNRWKFTAMARLATPYVISPPAPGMPVRFLSRGEVICAGRTDALGRVSCSSTLRAAVASVTGRFVGTTTLFAAQATSRVAHA